jgi:hypothetical protein
MTESCALGGFGMTSVIMDRLRPRRLVILVSFDALAGWPVSSSIRRCSNAVARQLVELSGQNIDIVYTGLRPSEKMHKDLLGDGEADERPVHPLVSQMPVPPLEPLTASELDPWSHPTELIKVLESMCDDLSMEKQRSIA